MLPVGRCDLGQQAAGLKHRRRGPHCCRRTGKGALANCGRQHFRGRGGVWPKGPRDVKSGGRRMQGRAVDVGMMVAAPESSVSFSLSVAPPVVGSTKCRQTKTSLQHHLPWLTCDCCPCLAATPCNQALTSQLPASDTAERDKAAAAKKDRDVAPRRRRAGPTSGRESS